MRISDWSSDVCSSDLALTERGVKAGIYSPLDSTRLRALLAELESALPPLEGTRRTALYTLAVLTGKAPINFPAEMASCEAIPRLERPFPVGNGAELTKRRPDLRPAERKLARTKERRVGKEWGRQIN